MFVFALSLHCMHRHHWHVGYCRVVLYRDAKNGCSTHAIILNESKFLYVKTNYIELQITFTGAVLAVADLTNDVKRAEED